MSLACVLTCILTACGWISIRSIETILFVRWWMPSGYFSSVQRKTIYTEALNEGYIGRSKTWWQLERPQPSIVYSWKRCFGRHHIEAHTLSYPHCSLLLVHKLALLSVILDTPQKGISNILFNYLWPQLKARFDYRTNSTVSIAEVTFPSPSAVLLPFYLCLRYYNWISLGVWFGTALISSISWIKPGILRFSCA